MKVLNVDYRAQGTRSDFTQSLRETGFAVLKNHPISIDLIFSVYEDWKKFFATECKTAYLFNQQTQAGYFPFRTENAKNYSVKDLKEFYHFFSWSELPKEVSSLTRELFNRLSVLAEELLSWIEEATPIEIKEKFSIPLSQMISGSNETLLRPIHYPPLTGQEQEGAIRAAAHEDINLITLLPSATAPGLQVKDTLGNWHDVSCDPGMLVVNAGDMLQMATEGFYQSTTHRVINPENSDAKTSRYSMPLFLHPRTEVRLSETHTAGSYLKERLEEIGLLKTKNKNY